jgi:hypothetical protein
VFTGRGSLTPDLLARVGIALFGEDEWKASLSNALQVNVRAIQRWAWGRQAMPDSLRKELADLLRHQRVAIENRIARGCADDDPAHARLAITDDLLSELKAK